ncbi:chemotaxis protein CheC [Alicyclobacillus kakegawensis]|uniref:chemotaxis protein CheC n=1 Tax=Alicyclobacillus kakegawensis TaxID=392012 RepID=UPI00082BC048|nr:chemotaxis protein CheC [Alicyclobacillus kakegawensis]
MRPLQLSPAQIDVLREMGNIGASHAATALSKLLSSTINMKMPSAAVLPLAEIAEAMGCPDKLMAGAYIRIDGDFAGNFLFLMDLESAGRLLDTLVAASTADKVEWSELELSTFGEVANILCASYMTAVTNLTHLNVHTSVPAIAVDMMGAMLDIALLDSAAQATEALLLQTEIQRGTEDLDAHLVLLPDPGAMAVLLRAVGCWDRGE